MTESPKADVNPTGQLTLCTRTPEVQEVQRPPLRLRWWRKDSASGVRGSSVTILVALEENLWDSHYFLLLFFVFWVVNGRWTTHFCVAQHCLEDLIDILDSELPASPPAEIWIRFPWVCLRVTTENDVIFAILTWHSVPLGLFTLFFRMWSWDCSLTLLNRSNNWLQPPSIPSSPLLSDHPHLPPFALFRT